VSVSGVTGGPVHAKPKHGRRMLVCECECVGECDCEWCDWRAGACEA